METPETNNIEQPVQSAPIEPEKSSDEILQSLMGDYKDVSMTVDPSPDEPEKTEPASPDDQPDDSDIQYYKTGKKKGQPRPRKGIKITPNDKGPETMLVSDVISGALFLALIDLLLPLLIETIHNRMSETKIDSKDMQMTADQRRKLEPIADALAKRWNMTAHPAILLMIAMSGIYGMNYLAVKMHAEQIAREKKQSENVR